MSISKHEYSKMVKKTSPNSPILRDMCGAFFIGGFICCIGQFFNEIYTKIEIGLENVRILSSITLIFLAALLTALGVFDKLAKFAGAGTLVPITGFSNAVVSPAIEYRSEGFILGVGANIFKIAGPVIVYGTAASVFYGVIYWIFQKI